MTELNSYPFLNNKHKPIFTSDLEDIVPRVRRERVIDVTNSPLVSAASLRRKLERLHAAGEIDGGLPILRNGILVGLIPAPDLEFALDQLSNEGSDMCLMADIPSIDDSDDGVTDPTDFTRYIDPVSSLGAELFELGSDISSRRHRWLSISIHQWTLCMNAS